jgi:hypothetical protein
MIINIEYQFGEATRTRCFEITTDGELRSVDCARPVAPEPEQRPHPLLLGVGDLVAGAAKAVGVTPSKGCGCEKRRAALNRATPDWVASVLSKLKNFVTRPPK